MASLTRRASHRRRKRKELPPVARRIRTRLLELGILPAELARRAGVGRVFVSELLTGKKKTLKYESLVALARALETSVQHLVGTLNSMPPSLAARGPIADPDEIAALEDAFRQDAEETPDEALPSLFRRWRHKSFRAKGSVEGPIPMFVAGRKGLVAINPSASGSVLRPPLLHWVDGAYAVIAGGDMVPRYLPGEILYAAPGVNVRDGDYAVVVTKGRSETLSARLARLVTMTAARVVVETLSPSERFEIPLSEVRYVHLVVMAGKRSVED
jgi:phage repressor protein C with HTH and peptisase S24 domain